MLQSALYHSTAEFLNQKVITLMPSFKYYHFSLFTGTCMVGSLRKWILQKEKL